MAEEQPQPVQPALMPVGKPLSLIPVVLKEAALDSPTFRATALHFGEQIDLIERWLENYVKTASKLVQEVTNLESTVNAFLAHAAPPQQISEAVLDHDYTLLAVQRYSEGAREFWQSTIKGMKRTDFTIVEPIKAFLQTDLRALKDLRRTLDATQKQFDGLIARYAGRKKSEEPSSLREDAFQLHEARKAYIKAAMDFCIMAPQIRTALDKLLVRVFSERWKEMKTLRESTDKIFSQYSTEMDRVRGWSREMENSERVFKRELHLARKQLEESAESGVRPSRELDDYSISTVPYIGSHGNLQSPAKPGPEKSEKQGWLFERTITGKPARTVWVRRWFFLKNGIFGWLVHGARSGAVEESEKVGVLLCGVRPAFQEERRFCFEVKTKDKTNMLQAESQSELMDWISTFEVAKRKALEDPASTEATATTSVDAAFAISPPVAPEFAARAGDGHNPHGSDELSGLKHTDTLPLPEKEYGNLTTRSSFDITSKRTFSGEKDGESSSRDHAARIIQKLDLHRRTTANPQLTSMPQSPNPSTGIAGLISVSHNIHNLLPVAPQTSSPLLSADTRSVTIPASSLAPSTLANPPAATNLSKTAVIISGERGLGVGRQDGVMPSGLLANLWGSTNWGYVNRFERGEIKSAKGLSVSQPPSPIMRSVTSADISDSVSDIAKDVSALPSPGTSPAPPSTIHRKTHSAGLSPDPSKTELSRPSSAVEEYPSWYPLPLRVQDAQFRLLFPNVPRDEKVVLVFRATWNPNEQQEFPGRVYVTSNNVYFYSNHLGLVLVTGVSLTTVDEVTAAPGRDCDFLFIHLKEDNRLDDYTRVTVKVFLEPLKLLQRRLNYLVRNCNSESQQDLETVIKTLLRMEFDGDESPGMESWDNLSNIDTPIEAPRRDPIAKTGLRIDGDLFANTTTLSRKPTRFKLPFQPVVYRPQGMTQLAIEREFDISAKALFHVMFGDKSAVFQMLFRERWPKSITQGPWVQQNGGGLHRREFEYRSKPEATVQVRDYQIIEVLNDHLCYVVADKKTPWYLPNSKDFVLISKFVITHVAKARCKLAIYTKLEWSRQPGFIKDLLERQALEDLDLESQDLTDVIADQVSRLGSRSRTRKAVQIFGYIGQQNQALQVAELPPQTRERRFKLQKRTVGSMFFDLGRAMAANWISTIIAAFTAVLAAVGKALTAHTMLVALLAFSGCMNLLWSYRDTWTWWQERNAGKFMVRMGVGPDTVMSKAVYLRDIDEIFVNATIAADFGIGLARQGGGVDAGEDGAVQNSCHHTFVNLLNNPDSSESEAYAPNFAPHLTPSTQSTSTRLQRTRQNLAAYRHDLLVAMRLVNRVEREVLQAEWENWVLDENVRCRRMGEMIKKRNATEGGIDSVVEWWDGYCGDCGKALEGLDTLSLK